MQSLFAQSHAINFQNEGRHAMEQNQPVNEGNVWIMDFWSATWHAANDLIITRICAVMAGQCLSTKECWDSLQSRFWQPNHPHNRSQREFQNCGLKHHDHHNESLQWRLSVAHEASILRKTGPVRGLTRSQKAKMNSFKTSQWRPSVKAFAETPSFNVGDGWGDFHFHQRLNHSCDKLRKQKKQTCRSGNPLSSSNSCYLGILDTASGLTCPITVPSPTKKYFPRIIVWNFVNTSVHVHLGISDSFCRKTSMSIKSSFFGGRGGYFGWGGNADFILWVRGFLWNIT